MIICDKCRVIGKETTRVGFAVWTQRPGAPPGNASEDEHVDLFRDLCSECKSEAVAGVNAVVGVSD